MRKSIKKIIIILILIIGLLGGGNNAFADTNLFTKAEYSNEFKEWLKLPQAEKESTSIPRIYEIENTKVKISNPIKIATLVKASNNSKYNLKDIIPNNLAIRNQGITNLCWAFATLSSLETNLALSNYNRGINLSKVYDFSERHMEYANSNVFLNNAKNDKGYNRKVGSGGSYQIASSYLVNGMGAVEENQMPFENNENIIDISSIQNKNAVTQVYDTVVFEDYGKANDEKKVEIINKIKKHIQNNGSVQATIHGNLEALFGECYNNETGAKFCNNEFLHPIDHGISIIGWDDNYSINNFPESCRPQRNGAWIVRNSWGEKIELSALGDFKKEFFNIYKKECIALGWNSPEEILNDFIIQSGFTIENDKVYQKYGDDGIIYVSYEDVNVSKEMFGIIKATDSINYDNIYQYDEYFPAMQIILNNPNILVCNIFDKKTSEKEYLKEIALYTPETLTCRVYVNPNGTSKAKKDLQLVSLKSGDSETFDAGYHTLEFSKPIEITSDAFAVVVEIKGYRDTLNLPVESKVKEVNTWDCVEVQNGKCFVASGNNLDTSEWFDLGKMSQLGTNLPNGDSTIKAFTINENYDGSLEKIEIINPPIKTKYLEGENFDKTGMQIKAYYRRKDNPTVILQDSEYSIENGNKLTFGQEYITIKYQDQSIKQNIIVEKNELIDLKIKTPPTKTEYKEGQNFDKTGMVVEGQYKNGELKTISDYEVKNGNNLKYNQEEVIITFEEKEVRQKIKVLPNPLIEIKLKTEANKTEYVVGQDFDETGMVVVGEYEDGTIQEILDYEIKNGTNLKIDQKYVIIEYSGKTAEQTIIVKEKQVTKISINKLPTKNQYIQYKEELDLTGGSLKVEYNDNSSEILDLKSKDIKISGFNKEKTGKQTIVLEYCGQTTNFEIKIIEEEKAVNSNFDKVVCELKKMKAYIFSEAKNEEYVIMDIEVKEIEKNLENDSYEYYYSVSSNKNDNDIKYWIKLPDKQVQNKKIEFQLNTKDLENFDELQDADALYLYIKEVVKKGSNQSVIISKSMELKAEDDVEFEIYLDNQKFIDSDGFVDDDGTIDDDWFEDDVNDKTIANQKLPAAGIRTIFVLIVVVLCVGIIKYIRYRKISKYID